MSTIIPNAFIAYHQSFAIVVHIYKHNDSAIDILNSTKHYNIVLFMFSMKTALFKRYSIASVAHQYMNAHSATKCDMNHNATKNQLKYSDGGTILNIRMCL